MQIKEACRRELVRLFATIGALLGLLFEEHAKYEGSVRT
jgi:hypothetical protein